MELLNIFLAVLAAWRLTHLISKEDGPWDTLVKFRMLLGNNIFGKLMDCFKCLSLWVAIPFSVYLSGINWDTLIMWGAISGAIIIIEDTIHKQGLRNNELLWSKDIIDDEKNS